MIDVRREHDVFVLSMNGQENRFNEGFLTEFNAALDEVEKAQGPAALVTIGAGKYYSNGLDLEWLLGAGATSAQSFIERVHALFARLLAFPRPTVSAINGHAFAAGAMLALCHDFRVMRSDRGYFCLPEVDIGVPFTAAMTALIQARLAPQVAHVACTTGRRYSAVDALAAAIVSEAAAEADVRPRAVTLASELSGKDPNTLGVIKRGLYAHVLEQLAPRAA